jgi:glycosyltransferase involved in cell wall biosynthesis
MIYFYHDGLSVTQLTNCGDDQLLPKSDTVVSQLFEVAARYPDENIIWVHKSIADNFDAENLLSKFKDNNYMLSLGEIKNQFLYPEIGYVTDGPFIAISEKVIYPTWLMQDTAGIVAAAVINQFDVTNYKNVSLEYFLTSVARIGQPQGLFCYHIPFEQPRLGVMPKDTTALFKFVVQHYKRSWSLLMFYFLFRYEKAVPFLAFLKSIFNQMADVTLDISRLQPTTVLLDIETEYDVIIPTMGRALYLKNVLKDLAKQTLLPQKVIIVEQNEDVTATTDLTYLNDMQWPFEVVHEFIHQTGACNARNLAISKTTAPWVLFFDDDNRFAADLLERIFNSLKQSKAKVLNMAYLQKGEVESEKNYKQLNYFGSGCSILSRDVINHCSFDMALEHGYGEDADYGVQIRNSGFDVIYAPQIQIEHLKAPVGGFRKLQVFPWHVQKVQPKPSPQLMYYRIKNNTDKQLKGYKLVLFLKLYQQGVIKNPIRYITYFNKAWKNSLYWSQKLAQNATN